MDDRVTRVPDLAHAALLLVETHRLEWHLCCAGCGARGDEPHAADCVLALALAAVRDASAERAEV